MGNYTAHYYVLYRDEITSFSLSVYFMKEQDSLQVRAESLGIGSQKARIFDHEQYCGQLGWQEGQHHTNYLEY